jgi:hypothetical protein
VKYGQIAGGESINAAIYRCVDFISEADAKAFVRKFAQQPHDQDQVMHTFRELIAGAFLASTGLLIESERPISGKTPDWTILRGGQPRCIIELVNFHTDNKTEGEIKAVAAPGGIWTGWQPEHADRLYSSIQNKCGTYKTVADSADLPYVVAVFSDFLAALDREEVEECMYDKATGLFNDYPEVSGVLFFDEFAGQYRFSYIPNHTAKRPFTLPKGQIDLSYFFRSKKP